MSEQEPYEYSEGSQKEIIPESEEVRQERLRHSLETAISAMAGELTVSGLDEVIRFLRTEDIGILSGEDFRSIEDRHGILVDGEPFFAQAFTGGREIGTLLRIAKDMGSKAALKELEALKRILSGPEQR